MRHKLRCMLATVTVLLVSALSTGSAAGEKDELVDNPLYKGWANFEPGSKVIHKETTVLGDSSVDEKDVEYKLETVTPKRVTLHAFVVVKELLSTIETTPTRIIYPAKVSKAALTASLEDGTVKRGKETITVLGKELECTTFEITRKHKTEEVKSKVWRSSIVPGGLVKRVRTTTEDGKLIATTTTTLLEFRAGPGKKAPKKE